MTDEGHYHVAVFHGRDEQYAPGLVLFTVPDGWEVSDELGEIGPPGTSYGVYPSQAAACREALRLLRAHYGGPTLPCWGAGAPNDALRALGYTRGRLRWRWWPPGPRLEGSSRVGPSGAPEPGGVSD